MSKQREFIDKELADWLHKQHVFFVATSPLDADGHVNCSPKGCDAFRVLGPLDVAYMDYTGSGAETIAHLRENGRILVMFCAFDGKPNVVRLHGRGVVLLPEDPEFEAVASHFAPHAGTRAAIRIAVDRVSTSCGFGVPLMDYREDRVVLEKWATAKGPEGLMEYRRLKNARSIDGLPALPSD